MKYFVTGGAGFIGSNFIRYLLNNRADGEVLNLDLLTYAGNLESIKDIHEKYRARYSFIKGDIHDEGLIVSIFKDFAPDVVVNFAAESHVDRSIIEPNIFVETNVLGTAVLLSTARKFWTDDSLQDKRFLQVSTDEVYGSLPEDKPDLKFTEQTALQPHSPYSASKASADLLVQAYFDTFGFPALITRCSNNYGPYQFPEKLIPLMIHNAKNDKSLPVYGDGKNIRDWLYVDDHCDAILNVVEKGKTGNVYNIGGNNEIRNIEIVESIINYLGKPKSLIQYIADRPGHDRRYAIDASKIKKEIGWEPKFKFDEMIKSTIDWYLDNSDWMEQIISGEYQNYYEKNYGNR